MKNSDDTVKLVGRPGNMPIVRQFENNKMVARFSFASNEETVSETGEKVWITRWHKVVAWGKCAAMVQQQVKKGKKMSLIGKNTCRQYTGTDGKLHEINEIVLFNMAVYEPVVV
jgi:single-strand DNA-binding protein